MNNRPAILRIHSNDDVAVALQELPAGSVHSLGHLVVTAQETIPRGHKLALRAVRKDEHLHKYGHAIGHATQDLQPGSWIHHHNLATNLSGTEEYSYQPATMPAATTPPAREFLGFARSNGDVGIRNELWMIPTVGCVNHICNALASAFQKSGVPGSIDGVYAFNHPYGCSQLGADHENTVKILAGLARHPNAGGVLVVGLGCENNTMKSFREALGDIDASRFRFLTVQEVGDEMECGLELLHELAAVAAMDQRSAQPLSSLKVGLKCGGSDAFSGITANPLVGEFSDRLIAHGGTTVLTEVPEMFGAERLLMARCKDHDVFNRCVSMVNGFKEYFLRHDQEVYENPSPGNKDGGISTLEEKSLGCTQKGGQAAVVDVVGYGEQLQIPGLNLLNGPGNDIVAVTVLAAAGVHLTLFTTGRGTPLGGPVPTVKIASNSDLAGRKSRWIDFDAGKLLDGVPIDQLADELLDQVIAIASGQQATCSEINGFREIAIFKDGVTL